MNPISTAQFGLVLDCTDPRHLADFWAAALGYENVGSALGARRISNGPCSEHGSSWLIMADPEGNEFCVCDHGTSEATAAG
jgi:hypothetical protein